MSVNATLTVTIDLVAGDTAVYWDATSKEALETAVRHVAAFGAPQAAEVCRWLSEALSDGDSCRIAALVAAAERAA